MKFFKLFSYALAFSSLLVLSGCGPTPVTSYQKVVETPATPQTKITPPVVEEDSTTETDPVFDPTLDTVSVDVTPVDLFDDPLDGRYKIADVQSLLSGFKLKEKPQFTGCAYDAISSCQTQTATDAAMTEKNADLCDNIQDTSQASSCKDQLWTQLASLEGQVELCDKISEDYSKIYCQDRYWLEAANKEANSELCENISESFSQDECSNQIKMQVAIQAQDAKLCKNIKMYEYVAIDLADPDANPEDTPAVENVEPKRTEVPEDQNYLLQDCLQQVAMSIEFAEQEAAMVELQAQEQAELELESSQEVEDASLYITEEAPVTDTEESLILDETVTE